LNPDSNPSHLRLFVAVQVPDEIKAALERAQGKLRPTAPESAVRWTNPGQMHLTLRFLGSVATERVEQIITELSLACRKFAPLELRAERIGFFPNDRRPRVLWAGVYDDTNSLVSLQQRVATSMSEFTSEPAEKKFVGHLTLARLKDIRKLEAAALERAAARFATTCFGDWTADSVELIRSQLSPHGAKYSTVAKIQLAADKEPRC
jgi:2'-5' RNA ligase